MASRKTVGLVLGSGASRGWAHIGVIEALEEANIPINLIAGSSVGAYIGAIYAGGGLPRLKEFLLKMNGKKIFSYVDVAISRSGLLDGTKRVDELFSMHTDAETFEDLEIPLVMVATDLERARKVILKTGSIIDALRATMSYPGLFSPVMVDGRWLVDGGVIDPVPVGIARAMGVDVIVAVDLNARVVSHHRNVACAGEHMKDDESHFVNLPRKKEHKRHPIMDKISAYVVSVENVFKDSNNSLQQEKVSPPEIIDTVTTAISIMEERITRVNLAVDRPDILIQPRLGEMKMMNFDQVQYAIKEGYVGAQEKIKDIQTILQ